MVAACFCHASNNMPQSFTIDQIRNEAAANANGRLAMFVQSPVVTVWAVIIIPIDAQKILSLAITDPSTAAWRTYWQATNLRQT